MFTQKEFIEALTEIDKVSSLIVGDAVRYGLSLEESYLSMFETKQGNDLVLVWLSYLKDECDRASGLKLYVCRGHMSQ